MNIPNSTIERLATPESANTNTTEQEMANLEGELRSKYRVANRSSRMKKEVGYKSCAAKEAIAETTNDLGAILEHEFITKSAVPRNETEAAMISTQEELGTILNSFMKDEPVVSYFTPKERAIHYGLTVLDYLSKGTRASKHLETLASDPYLVTRVVQTKLDTFKEYNSQLQNDSARLAATIKDISSDKNIQHCRLAQSSLRLSVLKDVRKGLENANQEIEKDYVNAIRTGDQNLVQHISAEMEKHEEDYAQLELDLSDTVNDLRNANYNLSILQNLDAQIREDALGTRKNIQHLGGLASKYAAILSIIDRLKGYAPGRELAELRSLVEKSDAQAMALGKLSAVKLRNAFALPEPRPIEIAQAYTDIRARYSRIDRLMDDAESLVHEHLKNPGRFIKPEARVA